MTTCADFPEGEHEIEGNEPEAVESLPVCERCRHRPARSFAPDGSMTCESCRLVESLLARTGSLCAITWAPGGPRVIESPSVATEAGDPEVWHEGLTVSQLLAMHGYTTHRFVIGADANAGKGDEQTNSGDDPVNHPSHYTSSPARCKACGEPIECIDITRHMGFNLGNTTKYVWRCDLKNDAIEDLEKAVFYLQDEIKERKRQRDSAATDE
ncbi:DUF3310 domain-containing protein [Mycobacteroides chelonae]|uniref:DUF3310 domain-containing protein n=1 Tax=Mycobacteroides chelonae TaxID=1774 RepID=UPI001F3A0D3A|nr:DUF3310 domain-containing protein [Mycobacteroides chelonae]